MEIDEIVRQREEKNRILVFALVDYIIYNT